MDQGTGKVVKELLHNNNRCPECGEKLSKSIWPEVEPVCYVCELRNSKKEREVILYD